MCDTVSPNVTRGLMAASRAHLAAVAARLTQRGYADFPIASASLLWLLDDGGTRSTVLAHRGGVTKQAMSQQVRLMERQGYLEQIADANDTRAKLVRMTRRGKAVKNACEEVRGELNQKIVKLVGKKDAQNFESNLDAIARMFGEIGS